MTETEKEKLIIFAVSLFVIFYTASWVVGKYQTMQKLPSPQELVRVSKVEGV